MAPFYVVISPFRHQGDVVSGGRFKPITEAQATRLIKAGCLREPTAGEMKRGPAATQRAEAPGAPEDPPAETKETTTSTAPKKKARRRRTKKG